VIAAEPHMLEKRGRRLACVSNIRRVISLCEIRYP
jgi:hypothetical protein